MPVTQLPDPNRGLIEAGRTSTESFINALRWAQQRKREKKHDKLEEFLRMAQEDYYRARAGQAREPKQVFTPAYTKRVLGDLETGSPYSPLGIPMETLTERPEHEAYATRKFGPDWEESIPQALELINRKFPIEQPVQQPPPINKGIYVPKKGSLAVKPPKIPPKKEAIVGPPSPGRGKFEPEGEHYKKQEWRDALMKTENGKIILAVIDMDIPLEKKSEVIKQMRSGGEIRVKNPKGITGTIPAKELLEALEQGYTLE